MKTRLKIILPALLFVMTVLTMTVHADLGTVFGPWRYYAPYYFPPEVTQGPTCYRPQQFLPRYQDPNPLPDIPEPRQPAPGYGPAPAMGMPIMLPQCLPPALACAPPVVTPCGPPMPAFRPQVVRRMRAPQMCAPCPNPAPQTCAPPMVIPCAPPMPACCPQACAPCPNPAPQMCASPDVLPCAPPMPACCPQECAPYPGGFPRMGGPMPFPYGETIHREPIAPRVLNATPRDGDLSRKARSIRVVRPDRSRIQPRLEEPSSPPPPSHSEMPRMVPGRPYPVYRSGPESDPESRPDSAPQRPRRRSSPTRGASADTGNLTGASNEMEFDSPPPLRRAAFREFDD